MSDEDLLGYLFDALEAPEIERVERELERDPLARARLEELRRVNRLLAEDDNIEPRMGLAADALNLIQRHVAAADRAAAREWAAEPASKMRAVDFAVVASVLGLAAVLVLPAIATLRGDQARMTCADYLRSLGVAINVYSTTENGQLPYVAPDGPLGNAGSYSVALRQRELIPNVRHLLCPAANAGVVMVPTFAELQKAASDPDRLATLKRYMGGSYGYLMGYQHGGVYHGRRKAREDVPILADRPPRGEEFMASPNSPNHGYMGQNVLFADGGVRWLPSPFWRTENFFLNNDGTVGAGLTASDMVIGLSEQVPHLTREKGM
jgi:hypothetical protein